MRQNAPGRTGSRLRNMRNVARSVPCPSAVNVGAGNADASRADASHANASHADRVDEVLDEAAIGFSLIGALLCACASGIPEPKTTVHANDDYLVVPYFPPAALVEVAGTPPTDRCVWFGGHWAWRGDKYVWKRGGWVQDHSSLYYAPWKVLVLEDGRLMFAEGTWYNDAGRRVAPPRIVKPARTPPNEVTSEFESPR